LPSPAWDRATKIIARRQKHAQEFTISYADPPKPMEPDDAELVAALSL
jgi:hypothetical protein